MILRGPTGLQALRRQARAPGRLHELPHTPVADAQADARLKPVAPASKAFEYADYEEMIRAFLAERPPIVVSPVLIDRHKVDWARKQALSSHTVWFVYCNHGGVVECVWWISGNSVHASIQGMKCYDMRGHASDTQAMAPATHADTQNG